LNFANWAFKTFLALIFESTAILQIIVFNADSAIQGVNFLTTTIITNSFFAPIYHFLLKTTVHFIGRKLPSAGTQNMYELILVQLLAHQLNKI
jgi:hypothetical protein